MRAAFVGAHSVTLDGTAIATVQYRAPRCILSQINTHLAFSRNARSSRAVPTSKLLNEVALDPVIPSFSGRNRPGMQAGEALPESIVAELTVDWLIMRDQALLRARMMAERGAHKQDVNRLLEPWMWVDGLITATDWANFFALRSDDDAQPEIQELAQVIRPALDASKPILRDPEALGAEAWHLPYITDSERYDYPLPELQLISAARCARVSFKPHDGTNVDVPRDLRRGMDMQAARPLHASPFEHVACPDHRWGGLYFAHPSQHRNFTGWRQFRAMLPDDTVRG